MKLVPVLRPSSSKPCSEIGRGRLIDHIQWGLLVPSDPVEVRASLQQVRGRVPLVAVAGIPEGLSDHLRIFGVRAEPAVCIHNGASSDQKSHDSRTVGKVPWPVSRRMQHRPVAVLGAKSCFREPWIGSEQALELSEVASLYGRCGGDSTWIIGGYEGYRTILTWRGGHGGQATCVPQCHP